MQSKEDANLALQLMAQRVGAPNKISMDNSLEQTLGDFRRNCQQMGTQIRQAEKFSPNVELSSIVFNVPKRSVVNPVVL